MDGINTAWVLILNVILLYLLYLFLDHFYLMSDVHGVHYHYARKSPGIIIGILVVLPVIISLRIKKYFRRQVMLIIKWDHDEFRIKFNDLNITTSELKRYFEGKGLIVKIVTHDTKIVKDEMMNY